MRRRQSGAAISGSGSGSGSGSEQHPASEHVDL
jgi:hypothetical protein